MDFHDQLAQLEDLADEGEVERALSGLTTLRAGQPPGNAAQVHLLTAGFQARLGRMDDALRELDMAEAFAGVAKRVDVQLEARVMRASVLAAVGDYGTAIPMLARVVEALAERPELALLRADAQAELASYRSLVTRPRGAG